MELKATLAGNASLRRGFEFFKAPNQKKNNTTKHLLEGMVVKGINGNGGVGVVSCTEEDIGGVVRMKIVVKRSELKQLVELMSGVKGEAHYKQTMSSSSRVEKRLNMLWRKHYLSKAKPFKCWSPVLQSIPEEL